MFEKFLWPQFRLIIIRIHFQLIQRFSHQRPRRRCPPGLYAPPLQVRQGSFSSLFSCRATFETPIYEFSAHLKHFLIQGPRRRCLLGLYGPSGLSGSFFVTVFVLSDPLKPLIQIPGLFFVFFSFFPSPNRLQLHVHHIIWIKKKLLKDFLPKRYFNFINGTQLDFATYKSAKFFNFKN